MHQIPGLVRHDGQLGVPGWKEDLPGPAVAEATEPDLGSPFPDGTPLGAAVFVAGPPGLLWTVRAQGTLPLRLPPWPLPRTPCGRCTPQFLQNHQTADGRGGKNSFAANLKMRSLGFPRNTCQGSVRKGIRSGLGINPHKA